MREVHKISPKENGLVRFDWRHEEAAWQSGHHWVAGVDEAGRGPWAGPVVAAAFMIPSNQRDSLPAGITDSKALNARNRGALEAALRAGGPWCFAVAQASAQEIDQINILQATLLAMRRAIAALPITPDFILVDGNRLPCTEPAGIALVQGDALSPSIAAASILAKEHRDRMMAGEAEDEYPGYGFARHKGYGTRQHQQSLASLGPCALHRRSFAPVARALAARACSDPAAR